MLKSVEGIFHNGKIELLEPAPQSQDAKVLITFFPCSAAVIWKGRGIGPAHAADLRNRLSTFAADWDSPEMDIYDDA